LLLSARLCSCWFTTPCFDGDGHSSNAYNSQVPHTGRKNQKEGEDLICPEL
jgi:hypothetical protein